MKSKPTTDTIAAISTPAGDGGIGIVRLSGPDAVSIACSVFLPKKGKKINDPKSYTMHYGWVVEGSESSSVIDEVIFTVMRAPRSYTKEDVAEINCHGGMAATRRVLELLLDKGARLAEPGEFTKRAFLNGRIDLAQAEAVLEVIRAKTDYALKLSSEQLTGKFSAELGGIRKDMVALLSMLEAGIDFPEEEIAALEELKIKSSLKGIDRRLKELLEGSRTRRLVREGLSVAICGKTNVGKSSLLNALLKRERSIVTPIAGTTRDSVEELMDIKGIPVRIIDTAGIIKPRDEIEHKAVKRSRAQIESSDLVILLFDGNKALSKEDLELIKKLKKREVIAVINKIDLKQKIDREKISRDLGEVIGISARKSRNIGLLEEAIARLAYSGRIAVHEASSVSSLRHIGKLRKAQKFVAEAFKSVDNKTYGEYSAQGLREALLCLDDILGLRFSEDLLDKIFSDFCIGK